MGQLSTHLSPISKTFKAVLFTLLTRCEFKSYSYNLYMLLSRPHYSQGQLLTQLENNVAQGLREEKDKR